MVHVETNSVHDTIPASSVESGEVLVNRFRPLLVLIALALALGACSARMSDHRPDAQSFPASPAIGSRSLVDGISASPTPPVIATPRWASQRSEVGGLPVPRGWKLIQRHQDGYSLEVAYAAPKSVSHEQVFQWYLAHVSQEKNWGDWRPCFPAGNGGGDDEFGRKAWWAFRNPRNHEHVIEVWIVATTEGGLQVQLTRGLEFCD